MHGGLYGATAPTFAVPFVHRIRRSARRESAKRARNVTCLRVLSILTHYSPLVRSSMSMWAYRIDCRIPFRTLANWNESRIAPRRNDRGRYRFSKSPSTVFPVLDSENASSIIKKPRERRERGKRESVPRMEKRWNLSSWKITDVIEKIRRFVPLFPSFATAIRFVSVYLSLAGNIVSDVQNVVARPRSQKYVAEILIPFLHTVRSLHTPSISSAYDTRCTDNANISRPHFILAAAAANQRRASHDVSFFDHATSHEKGAFFPLFSPPLFFILIHKNSRALYRVT